MGSDTQLDEVRYANLVFGEKTKTIRIAYSNIIYNVVLQHYYR